MNDKITGMNNKNGLKQGLLLALLSIVQASTATQPSYNWSGLYIGGFLGGASGARVITTEPVRLDNDTYWFRPFHNSFVHDSNPSFITGGAVGYNWVIGKTPYLLGLEGEYGYLNEKGQSVDPNQTPYANLPSNNQYNTSVNRINIGSAYSYAMLGGRVGYVKERLLFYMKSGAVLTQIESQYSSAKTDSASSTGIAYLNISGTNHITGYGVGGGIEYVLPFKGVTNWSAKIEYLYLGIDSTQLAYGHCTCDFLWGMTERIHGLHSVKFGINYKLL